VPDNTVVSLNTVPNYFKGAGAKSCGSGQIVIGMAIPYAVSRTVRNGKIYIPILSEAVHFRAYFTENSWKGRRTATIQLTGGHSAYNVVDEAS